MTAFSRILLAFALLSLPAAMRAQEKSPGAANPLALSASQKQAIQQALQSVEVSAKTQAETLAQKIVPIAKDLDKNMLSEKPDPEVDRKLSKEFTDALAALVGTALEAKLNAMREVAKVLTPEQKAALLAELEKPGANPDLTELIPKVFGDVKK